MSMNCYASIVLLNIDILFLITTERRDQHKFILSSVILYFLVFINPTHYSVIYRGSIGIIQNFDFEMYGSIETMSKERCIYESV